MNSSLLPTSEGPGSARAAPNRPPGFADAFTSVVSDDLTELCEKRRKAPTRRPLVIFGRPDRYLDRVERLPNASHWVHHDVHQRVTQPLIDLFAPARPATVRAPVVHPADSIAGAGNNQKGEL